MEYDYKREVMERLGIAILDEQTMVDSRGQVLASKQIDVTSADASALPPGTAEVRAEERAD